MLEALEAEWDRHPPVHHLVAAYLDYKPRNASSSGSHAVTDIEPLLSELGNLPIRQVQAIDTSAFDAAFPQAPQETQDG